MLQDNIISRISKRCATRFSLRCFLSFFSTFLCLLITHFLHQMGPIPLQRKRQHLGILVEWPSQGSQSKVNTVLLLFSSIFSFCHWGILCKPKQLESENITAFFATFFKYEQRLNSKDDAGHSRLFNECIWMASGFANMRFLHFENWIYTWQVYAAVSWWQMFLNVKQLRELLQVWRKDGGKSL